MNSREILKVIKGDYCVGCGTCAGCNKKISMEFNDNGQYQPVFKSKLSCGPNIAVPRAIPMCISVKCEVCSISFSLYLRIQP